jgi:hypothetical protein
MISVSFGGANLQVKTEMPVGLSVKICYFSDFNKILIYTWISATSHNINSHQNPFIIYEVVTYEQADSRSQVNVSHFEKNWL